MDYKGIVIEESLSSKKLLSKLKVLERRKEKVTEWHNTPWLHQWTFAMIQVPEEKADHFAEKLRLSIEQEHGGAWYIDYKNEKTHYIIFPHKVFKVDRQHPEEYEAVRRYGMSLGIPRHQLDFEEAKDDGIHN